MNSSELTYNDILAIAQGAKDQEKKGFYESAAIEYRKASEHFKRIDEIILMAKCMVGHKICIIKYYLDERDIEGFSINIITKYIDKIITGLNNAGLNGIDKYDISITAFRELEKIFADHYMSDMEDKAFFEKTKLHHVHHWEKVKSEKNFLRKFKHAFHAGIHLFFHKYCGHGTIIPRPIFLSLFFVTMFSAIYCFFNLVKYANPCGFDSIGWFQSLYFSFATFTTLGFGDIIPINWIGQLLVIIEVMMGYLMLGTLIAILIRKITK